MSFLYKIIFLFLVVVFIIGCSNDSQPTKIDKNDTESIKIRVGKKEIDLHLNFNKINRETSVRKWKQLNIISYFFIGDLNNELLLYPSQVKTDFEENIYILDSGDNSVKKFTSDGKYLMNFGKKGRGPGEFTSVFGFDIAEDGRISILSPNDNKFVVFTERDFIEFKCKFMPLKHCFVNSNEIVTFQIIDPISTSTFQRINYELGSTYEYENLIEGVNVKDSGLGMLPFLIGEVHKYKRNELIYISAIMGYVVLYDGSGKIKNAFKLLDVPKLLNSDDNRKRILGSDSPIIRFPRKDEYLLISSSIYHDYLYILCNNSSQLTEQYVIDIYSLKNNSYQYSIKLHNSEEILWMHITNSKIFLVQNNAQIKIISYKII
jgi:hypothetical protein